MAEKKEEQEDKEDKVDKVDKEDKEDKEDKDAQKPDKTVQPSHKRKPRNWQFIDSILFMIIIIMLTLMMVFAALADKEVAVEKDFQRTDEFSDQVLNTFITGTYASANYTDYDGTETVYSGWSVRPRNITRTVAGSDVSATSGRLNLYRLRLGDEIISQYQLSLGRGGRVKT